MRADKPNAVLLAVHFDANALQVSNQSVFLKIAGLKQTQLAAR
jgi:hypothetical protein